MMAKHGLGLLEEDVSSAGVVDLSTPPPPPEDVHNVSTMVAELPPHILESLKPPGLRAGSPDSPSRPSPLPRPTWHGRDELVDLVERSDPDEPETLQLDTVMLDVDSLPPLASWPMDEAAPQTIELHLIRESGAFAALETELARLPRPWVIAGAVVASASIAGVTATLCWTLVRLVF